MGHYFSGYSLDVGASTLGGLVDTLGNLHRVPLFQCIAITISGSVIPQDQWLPICTNIVIG